MDDPSLMPDLSHLSAEEREIIEQVFKRQKDEEAKEVQLTQKADAELDQIDKQINERKEIARRLVGTHDDAICQICQRTKFADGIGHKCFYCQLRSCARCGGRSQSKNKAIWACSLCQKRQQILAKTGKWFQPDEAQHKLSNAGHDSPSQSMSPTPFSPHPSQPQQQQEAFSGVHPSHHENENRSRAGSKGTLPQQQLPPQKQGFMDHPASIPKQAQEPSVNGPSMKTEENIRRQNTLQRQPSLSEEQSRQHGNGALPHQQFTTSRRGTNRSEPFVQQRPNMLEKPEERENLGQTQDKRAPLGGHAREEKRHKESSPVFLSELDNRFEEATRSNLHDDPGPQKSTALDQRRLQTSEHGSAQSSSVPREKLSSSSLPRGDEARRGTWRTNVKSTEVHSSHMSSGPSQRGKKSRLHRQTRSMSSSEEDLPSTSVPFDEEEVQRAPSECISEKDLLRYIYGPDKLKNSRKSSVTEEELPHPLGRTTTIQNEANTFKMTRKKGGIVPLRRSADEFRSSVREPPSFVPGDLLAAKIRTYLSHPVTWQPSADQRRLIGHMVLHKADNSKSGDLGLKVVGGRRTDTGRLGAFITRVKPGSVADTVGRLRAGDEVLEWNGQALQNATFDQVYEIISASKKDSHVEIIVSRSASVPGGDDFLNVQAQSRQLPSLQYLLSQEHEAYASSSTSPLLPLPTLSHSQSAILALHPHVSSRYHMNLPCDQCESGRNFGRGQIFGRIEISLYFSHVERQLTVCIERVADLPPRADGSPRNPYVKVFLLPDRSEKSRRQTSVIAEAIRPIWNEAFYYQGITEPMLMERVLEVTVWDYDKFEANSFLGETLVDFSTAALDGQTMTLPLVDMDEENPLRLRLRSRKGKHYTTYQRPRSEMGFLYSDKSPCNPVEQYADPPQAVLSEGLVRRSRTHDKPEGHGKGVSPWMDEDWSIQPHSGYLSDHGYFPNSVQRTRQRRPRSATAMRPTSEMVTSRMYYRAVPEPLWDDVDISQEGSHGLSRNNPQRMSPYGLPDAHSSNGRSIAEMMQEQETQQGYGSDGSETMSTHSAHSIPTVRTINRRSASINEVNDVQETSLEEYASEDVQTTSGTSAKLSLAGQAMKERKKSIMTRFIPGKSGGTECKRTGFLRSEEVGIPGNMSANRAQPQQFVKQASKESTDSASDNWLPVLPDGPLGAFVENLGPGQVVGRQVLASPLLGEIQVGIMAGRSGIDVEIIRAKNLVVKPGVKMSPAPYVKVYLMEGKMCVAKAKTNPVRKTTAPLFQQHLIFSDSPKRKMLQITVLGDYGRMERKTFMGIALIRLDDLRLGSEPVIGWYKLYHSSSLAGTGPVRKDSETSLVGPNTMQY